MLASSSFDCVHGKHLVTGQLKMLKLTQRQQSPLAQGKLAARVTGWRQCHCAQPLDAIKVPPG